jgi:hypothetical protein|tara:strand:- start:130 stop:855 length:726 start_codon:yes stop_codon:yes gene_type:complete
MEKMKLRKLRDKGIDKMSSFLDSLKTENPLEYPSEILNDPEFSDSIGLDVIIEAKTFNSKFDVAKYFYEIFSNAGLTSVLGNRGLWCWLSLYFFDQLCPRERGGRYRPGARARWIPEVTNFQRYYRHLLAGPYRIYNFHKDDPERAMALICGPVSKQGDLIEQLASRQELITNKSLIKAVTELYYNPSTGTNKRGAGGKGAGSPRRLAEVIDQYNLTWDLYAISPDEIIGLLPSEFDRFKN